MTDALPIDDAIPDLRAALTGHGRAVLVAPPGAGKTTRVPLALLDMVPGRIVMLEPRRLAARAAAERMAATLGEPLGATVGYRIRGEAVPGARIEVVTEGILTRMIQSDPDLPGVGCVIFDEFHERSLNADLGLALVWESRGALRPDLAVLVMSATLDAEPVAALLDDAPVVRSLGRAFPVETRWLERPLPEEGSLPAFAPPEIATADLAGLALELAAWGSGEGLAFLTPPPAPALAEARALLENLGALKDGRITPHGRALAALPLHPRLGHMLLRAGRGAAELAALMAERDPIRGAPADLSLRLEAIRDPRAYAERHPWPADRGTVERIRAEGRRLRRLAPDAPATSPGGMAALAYPDRVGLRRKGDAPRYVLSGGKGTVLAEGDPLGAQRLIVATDLDGDAREARVRIGAALDEADLRALCGDRIEAAEPVEWSRREGRVLARRQERFGALVLSDRALEDPDPEAVALAA